MGFSVRNLVKKVGADINPFDGPAAPRPATTAPRPAQALPAPGQLRVGQPTFQHLAGVGQSNARGLGIGTSPQTPRGFNQQKPQVGVTSYNLKHLAQQAPAGPPSSDMMVNVPWSDHQVPYAQSLHAPAGYKPAGTFAGERTVGLTSVHKSANVQPHQNIFQRAGNTLQRDVIHPVQTGARDVGGAVAASNRFLNTAGTGVQRSLIGTAQGASGLYDLATPGVGTNRFSKTLNQQAKNVDAGAKKMPFPAAYKAGQAIGDAATFVTAGGIANGAKALPGVAKVASTAGKVSTPVTNLVDKGAARLAEKGFTGRVASRAVQNVTNPTLQAGNAAFTALQTGKEASQGKKTTAAGVTTNLVAGGLGLPVAGAVAHEVAAPVIKGATTALKDAHLIAPSRLNPAEVTHLSNFRQQAGTGAISDPAVYQKGVAAAQKAGVDYRDPKAVDDLLGAHRTHAIAIQQRAQALQDAKNKTVDFAQAHPIGLTGKAVDDNGNPLSVLTGKSLNRQIGRINGQVDKIKKDPGSYDKTGTPTGEALTKIMALNDKGRRLLSSPPTNGFIEPKTSASPTKQPPILPKTAAPPKVPAKPISGTVLSDVALPEYGTKNVKGIDKAFRSTRSIIERQGEHGKKLAGMLQGARDTEEIYQGQLAKQLPTVRSLKGNDFENFVEATQGKAKANSPKIEQAVKEWQTVHPGIRDRAVKAGLDVGDLGPSYYPHFIDYEKVFKNKNTFNQAINHLVDTGQAKSPEDAMKLLNYAKDVSRNRSFGNLEAQRLIDLPMYDKTPNSLTSYLGSSAKRIAQTETFGAKDERALKLITRAGQQGHDTEAMKNAYDVAVGAKRYGQTATNFSNKARAYQSTTRLGLGAITNATQNVNTGIVTGHLRTLGAMVKQLDPKTRSFVEDTGTISDAVLNDLKTQAGFVGKGLSKITAPGFNAVEKFNRSVASTAGRDYGLRLAQKGDEATLRKLGVTGEIKNNTLTHSQQVQIARKVVEKTQFKVDAQDLPGWADTPGGKLVSQFRTFSYSQSKFFSNQIIKPAAKGNLMPLGRLLAALPVGYGVYETKRKIAGRPEETSKTRRGVEAFGNVGGAGLAIDIFRGLVPLNGKYLTPDRFTSMAAGTLGGPTVGAAVDAAGAAVQSIQKKNLPASKDDLKGKAAVVKGNGYYDATTAARFGFRQIPIVGTAIQNRVLPYAPKTGLHKDQQQIVDGSPANKRAALTKDFQQQNKVALETKKQQTTAKFNSDTSKLSAVDKLKATEKSQSTALKNSLSAEDYKLSKLSKTDRQKLIDSGAYTQKKFDGLDNYVSNQKNKLGITTASSTTDPYKSPDAEYKALQKSYNDSIKNNKYKDTAQRIKAETELNKAKVGKDFSKDTRDLYGLSDAQLYNYVSNDPKGNDIVKKVIAYGDALTAAGFSARNKFKDKYGNVTLGKSSTGSGSSGSRSTRSKAASSFVAALKTRNSVAKGNETALQNLIKNAKVTSPGGNSKNVKVAKVTLKKQSVKKMKAKVV